MHKVSYGYSMLTIHELHVNIHEYITHQSVRDTRCIPTQLTASMGTAYVSL